MRRPGWVLGGVAGLLLLPMMAQAQTYGFDSVNPGTVGAGAAGVTFTIGGNLPAFSPTGYGMCFYTGFGSTAPILGTNTGPSSATVTVPASTIQQIPPGQFSGGDFTALLYVAPATSVCDGNPDGALTTTVDIDIQYPAIETFAAGSIPQTNAATGAQPPPYTVTFTGANYVSNSVVNLTWAGGSGTATTHLASGTSLVARLPGTISATATSVSAMVCNHAPSYDYCAPTQVISLTALAGSSGALTPTPSPATVQQSVALAAQFSVTPAVSNPNGVGTPTGVVAFQNGTTLLGTGKLVLDKSGTLNQVLTTQTNGLPALPAKMADLNGDGLPDAVFFDGSGQLHVELGTTPFGSFLPDAVSMPDGSCGPIYSFAVGDVNGDGYPDMVFNCETAGGTLTDVVLNNGDGSFGLPANVANVYGLGLQLADINHDGKMDLVSAGLIDPPSCGSGVCHYGFMVFAGDGNGGFSLLFTTQTTATPDTTNFLAADLDGDGYPDLVTLNTSGVVPTVDIYADHAGTSLGKRGEATYLPDASIALGNDSYGSLFAGDFNGDGMPDLGVAQEQIRYAAVTAVNTSKAGAISFAATNTLPLTSPLVMVRAADFNGDGFGDLLVTMQTGATVYDGDGTGGFGTNYPGLTLSTAGVLQAVAADVNADGDADVLVFSETGGVSSVSDNLISYVTSGPGNASLSTSFAQSGNESLTVSWPGNVNMTGSIGTAPLTVNAAGTLTSLVGSGSPTEYGQTVMLTGTVSSTAATGTPSGTITFMDGSTTLATVTMVNGAASYSTATLNAGGHTLTAVYSGDPVFAMSTSGNVSQTVTQAQPTVAWTPLPVTIPYGTALVAGQLNATASSKYVVSVAGSFNYTPALGAVLGAGPQTLNVTFTPTDMVNFKTATGTAGITVNKATPTVNWSAPAAVVVGTPLSGTQLDATATGVSGSLQGSFVYTPAAGTVLSAGSGQALAVTFTPTDTTDYNTATGGTTIDVIPLVVSAVTPGTASLGDAAKTVTVTGTGFLANSVVQVNGTAVTTTYVSATSLTAVIPASYFLTVQTLSITVYDPTQAQTSSAGSVMVTATAPAATFSGPSTAPPATQPSLTFTLTNPYPVPLSGTLSLAFAGTGGVDDPAIQFAGGSRTMNFTVAANSTTTPSIQLQSGTVAGTITVTLTLTAGGQNVTPGNVQPIVITIPPAVPTISSETVTRSGETLTVVVHGFSNTREMTTAVFHFAASDGNTINDPDLTLPAATLFAGWFGDPSSPTYGSTFTYTQIFNLSKDANTVGTVTVTLTNSVGNSSISSAQ